MVKEGKCVKTASEALTRSYAFGDGSLSECGLARDLKFRAEME